MLENIGAAIKEYILELATIHDQATELSYRTSLINLISKIYKNCRLISEPKSESQSLRIDLRALIGDRKAGYIETKDIGTGLDKVLGSEQLKRYMSAIQNMILTDYLEFILIRNGEVRLRTRLAHQLPRDKTPSKISKKEVDDFKELLDAFFNYRLPIISSSTELAGYLSAKARILKLLSGDEVLSAISGKDASTPIKDFVMLITPLLNDAPPPEYTDAYAQTISFGILLAKSMNRGSMITRENAASYIPQSVRIIRRILLNIIDPGLPNNIGWVIDDIIDVVNASDLSKILIDIKDKIGGTKEAFLLFYEQFLGSYDPEKRKRHGVYYTPRPVVSFIVNNVNKLLKEEFGKSMGLGNNDVTILDPATGTGTFLAMAFLIALLEVKSAGYGGMIHEKIANHLLKDFYGFELLVAPYVLSHLRLTSELENTWFYKFRGDDRVQIYLTNTLRDSGVNNLFTFDEILQETRIASEIKNKRHVLAIIGNPPYSAVSQNKGGYIEDSLKDGYTLPDGSRDQGYYIVDEKPLDEKNPKWLNDDYVKFIRFGQWKIAQNGEGVMAYISNNGYLDNATFAGMRQSLLSTFDEIYVVNLHGSSRKKEGYSGDENVFNIMQGVTISFFVKHRNHNVRTIKYAEVYGKRVNKFRWLDTKRMHNIDWVDISPKSPLYLLIPNNTDPKYYRYPSLRDIFPINSVGITTARDHFTIAFKERTLQERIEKFVGLSPEEARSTFNLGEDKRDWKVEFAQKDLHDSGPNPDRIVKLQYRPLDFRYTYYTGKSRGFICMPRTEVMGNMVRDNIALLSTRGSGPESWNDIFVSDLITDIAVLSSNTSRSSYHFPLYIYNNGNREANINEDILRQISERFGKKTLPEELFYYVYGVLNSSAYRDKFKSELRTDFPRIPFPDSHSLFVEISNRGKMLASLHTMKEKLPGSLGYPQPGDNRVTKVLYAQYRVYINDSQYFDRCSQEIWGYRVGSYRVLEKWLKSRKGETLRSEDIEYFSRMANIIEQTSNIRQELESYMSFL